MSEQENPGSPGGAQPFGAAKFLQQDGAAEKESGGSGGDDKAGNVMELLRFPQPPGGASLGGWLSRLRQPELLEVEPVVEGRDFKEKKDQQAGPAKQRQGSRVLRLPCN